MPEPDLPDFKSIPGTVKIVIEHYQAGDPQYQVLDPNGSGKHINPGYRLSELIEQHGNSMIVTDPFRMERYEVSLKPFLSLNPETTFLLFKYQFKPDPAFVLAHPEMFPKAPGSANT